jgi:hypothetical protein
MINSPRFLDGIKHSIGDSRWSEDFVIPDRFAIQVRTSGFRAWRRKGALPSLILALLLPQT